MHAPTRLNVFSYVTAEKAELYQAIMQSFMEARTNFILHLRPHELLSRLQSQFPRVAGLEASTPLDELSLTAALTQLCQWRNLDNHLDTSEVTTVEDFKRQRFLYQLTPEGEAAERALHFFHAAIRRPGELQTMALSDIRALLHELTQLIQHPSLDEGKLRRTLDSLCNRFDELTDRAQAFIGSLQRTIDLHGISVEAFLTYKGNLIGYLERFIGELVVATADIVTLLEPLSLESLQPLLVRVAALDLADALMVTDADRQEAEARWSSRWSGLRAWFVGRPGLPSQAEHLRSRARAAIPALLNAVASIHDRRVTRTDRAADLRTLARWFAQLEDDASAHRLFRAAFSLNPSRHLSIDRESLDARLDRPIPPATPWFEAPALVFTPRLRTTGRTTRTGRALQVIDRSREKALLASTAAQEVAQLEAARTTLLAIGHSRLSDVQTLDPLAFELFLDLLGEALSRKVRPDETVEATSSDGSLKLTLEPVGDGRQASLRTRHGTFSGPDHWLWIRDAFSTAELPARTSEPARSESPARSDVQEVNP